MNFAGILTFVQTNIYQITVALGVTTIAVLSFYITIISLRKLKVDVFAYYPFDKFFPQSGSWSILYFVVVVIFLGALIYLLAKGGFYLSPA